MHNKNRAGSALLTVMVIMMFVTVLTLSMVAAVSAVWQNLSAAERFDEDYYTAESGMNMAITLLYSEDNPAGRFYYDEAGSLDTYPRVLAAFERFLERGIPETVSAVGELNGRIPEVAVELLAAPGEERLADGFALGAYTVRLSSASGARLVLATLDIAPVIVAGTPGEGDGYQTLGGNGRFISTVKGNSGGGIAIETSLVGRALIDAVLEAAQNRRREIRMALVEGAEDPARPYVTVNSAADALTYRSAEYIRFGSGYNTVRGEDFPNARYIKSTAELRLTGAFKNLREVYTSATLHLGPDLNLTGDGSGAMIGVGTWYSEQGTIRIHAEQTVTLRNSELSAGQLYVETTGNMIYFNTDARFYADHLHMHGSNGKYLFYTSEYAGQYYANMLDFPGGVGYGVLSGVFVIRDASTFGGGAWSGVSALELNAYMICPEKITVAGTGYAGYGGTGKTVYHALPAELTALLEAAGITVAGGGTGAAGTPTVFLPNYPEAVYELTYRDAGETD